MSRTKKTNGRSTKPVSINGNFTNWIWNLNCLSTKFVGYIKNSFLTTRFNTCALVTVNTSTCSCCCMP